MKFEKSAEIEWIFSEMVKYGRNPKTDILEIL